jgi:integrase
LHADLQVIPVSESKTDIVRVVYLADDALAITQRLMVKHPQGPLFLNSRRRPWTTDAVNNALERVQVRMGRQAMQREGLTVSDDSIAQLIHSLRPTRVERGVERLKRPAELRHEAKSKLSKKLACSLAPRYCLYHIRHTWMNRLLTSGVDAMTVAILAGHKDPSTLAKTYQHLSQNPQFLLDQVRRVG